MPDPAAAPNPASVAAPKRGRPRKPRSQPTEYPAEAHSVDGNGQLQGDAPSIFSLDSETGDNWDLGSIQVSQDFVGDLGLEGVLTGIRVGKPRPTDWVRTHTDPDYQITAALLEDADRELYLVDPYIYMSVRDEEPAIRVYRLITTITSNDRLTLWPLKLLGPDDRPNTWIDTALEAARLAQKQWIRVTANQKQQCYVIKKAKRIQPDPEWPNYSFQELLKLAFRDRRISSIDHPVLDRLLRGG
jgi:hypothetical protein